MDYQNIQNDYDVAKELIQLTKQDTLNLPEENSNKQITVEKGSKFLSIEKFENMNLNKKILQSLYKHGYSNPSIIQSKVIPTIINGGDIVVQSRSGTGKTIAYVVGILSLIKENGGVQCVILSPTRELNLQIYNVLNLFMESLDIRCYLAIRDNKTDLSNEEIILGSPGTILSLCSRRKLDHRSVKLLVLDETDVLLDRNTMGSQSFRLLKAFEEANKIYISATYNDQLKNTINVYSPESSKLYETKNSKPEEILLYYIEAHNKEKYKSLISIYSCLTVGQVIVFVSKKVTLKKLEEILKEDQHCVSILHGDLDISERDEAVNNFKNSKTKILVTTDIFSRGMDIPQVNLIINFDLPYNMDNILIDTYIHRIGRSGRFGRSGFVIDMISGERELRDYLKIQEALNTVSKKFSIDSLMEAHLDN